MRITLNTIGFNEEVLDIIENNKKNAIINSILTKAFLDGTAYETLLEHISIQEIRRIKKRVDKLKINPLLPDEEGLTIQEKKDEIRVISNSIAGFEL